MKEKNHITVLTLWIYWLMGLTFASFSSQNWWTKVDNIQSNSIQESFVCSETALAKKSEETKEYNKNIKKINEFLSKVDSLGGNRTSLKDPCDKLKWKERTECNFNNVQLKGLLIQVKQLKEKILPYEECMKKLWILEIDITTEKVTSFDTKENKKSSQEKKSIDNKSAKDCGSVSLNAFMDIERTADEIKNLTCFSRSILDCSSATLEMVTPDDGTFTYQVYSKKQSYCTMSISVDIYMKKCNIPRKIVSQYYEYQKKEKEPLANLITPIIGLLSFEDSGEWEMAMCQETNANSIKWSEWEWSLCSNGKQKRTVECQSSGNKVSDTRCEWEKPPIAKACKTSQESDSKNAEWFAKNNLYGPWVAATQSYIVNIGDLVQFTSDKWWEYIYSCGKDGKKTVNELNSEGEKLWTFYCIYTSVGDKIVTISYKWKVISSKTFIVKEKIEQSTTKSEQKKYKCVETDEGLDYNKKWSVTGIWDFYTGDLSDPLLISTHSDICIYGWWVLEYSCDVQGKKTSTNYACPDGCKDWACIK